MPRSRPNDTNPKNHEKTSPMKRSQKEYDEILGFIKTELINTPNPWNKPPTKELEARFNVWATNNNIKPVGLRTIQNYLNALKDDKELNLYNHNNSLNQNRQDSNKFYSTKSLNPNEYEVERIELVQKLLEPWHKVLPQSITKELAQPVKGKDKADYPALTVAHPRYQPKSGLNDLVLQFLSLIKQGKICRFTYKPSHSSMDDNMDETPDGFSWLKVVYGLPLQLNIYMDRVYLLSYSLTKKDLLERKYVSAESEPQGLDYTHISRYVLANIYEYKVVALEEFVKDSEELAPLRDPVQEFQERFKPTAVLEEFSIPQIQDNMIGVVLPTEEQLRSDADPSLADGLELRSSPFKPYCPPQRIQRYFSDWAMRYILNSPLHPSQVLKETKVVFQVDDDENVAPKEHALPKSIEIGLFEFTVWNTDDFKFRVTSFREYSWPAEFGFENKRINNNA